MKIFKGTTVWEESLDRIRYIFDEFPRVVVSSSSGKDSTVVMELALQVAREKGRLPLRVEFLAQEAEWGTTVDYFRKLRDREGVELRWFQMPMRIFNATSHDTPWLECWFEGQKWIREPEPGSITKNVYGSDRFKELFHKIPKVDYQGEKVAYLTGIRTEESPGRFLGITGKLAYQGVTWGTRLKSSKDHITFHPLYDWSFSDVWKAIFDNGWDYNKMYVYMFQYGRNIKDMRVSNITHEQAVKDLFILQEIDPDLYRRLVERLPGVQTAGKMNDKDAFFIKELPFMFSDWKDYRDHLLKYLIPEEKWGMFHRRFERCRKFIDRQIEGDPKVHEQAHKMQAKTIILNDYHFTNLTSFEAGLWMRPDRADYNFLNKHELDETGRPSRK